MESNYASEGRELRIEYSFLRRVAGVPTKFRYKELEDATDHFQALLGKGASLLFTKGSLVMALLWQSKSLMLKSAARRNSDQKLQQLLACNMSILCAFSKGKA
ncbi:putative receptor-like protein kinase [Prunus yedoensis var. nudiflora]|uniref:Putative receptor-like protein kinase n=1 Tax=Prunus yedoensis var. nudiflora TaxID=2094558 RepID=A0A314ZNM1_PRUYE|nr:putative receptor-like protein kinase [Prunus yedoensis var. nudiflora]